MGYTNIFVVRDAVGSKEQQSNDGAEIGAAVAKLAYAPDYETTSQGKQRVTEAPVSNHGNRVAWVDEVHSSDQQVYVWMGNNLRSLTQLSAEELAIVKERVQAITPGD